MESQSAKIERELEEILIGVAQQRSVRYAASLRSILLANLERGRIDFYLNSHAQAELRVYVWRVADHYDRLGPYLRKVQQTKSAKVWELLIPTLRKWARGILQRAPGFSGDLDQLALEYTSTAAEKILTAHFPYDTEFEPWAYVLVRNVCRQQLRRDVKDPDPIDDEQVAHLSDLAADDIIRVRGLRQELVTAIERLSSDARRELIVLHYFQGYSLSDIAARLHRTMSAIYKLHFDALGELRKIWASQEHKDE